MAHSRNKSAGLSIWAWAAALFSLAIVGAYVWLRMSAGAPPPEAIAPVQSGSEAQQSVGGPAVDSSAKALPPAPAALQNQLAALAQGFEGEVGIAVRSVEDGWIAGHALGKPFPQQSVSKLWVASTVMARVDAGELSLDDTIPLTKADLTIFHQPIRKYILAQGTWRPTVAQLLYYAMTQSDNAANDALLRSVGGQAGVERFLAERGITGIAMSEGEKALQMGIAGMEWDDRFSYGRNFWWAREKVPFAVRQKAMGAYLARPADGAQPQAIADALAQLAQGELVSKESSAYLIDLMGQSKTGPKRLRGNLPAGWQLPHKTGTGQVLKLLATAYNDVGILTSPTGRRYALVVMIGATNRPVSERQALMQAVTASVIAHEGT